MREFLLGSLQGVEREKVNTRLFESREFFDQMLEIENDLFDAYAAGRLNTDDRKSFERSLLANEAQRSKLGLALALADRRPVRNRTNWMAAAAILIVGLWLGILLWQNKQLRAQLARVHPVAPVVSSGPSALSLVLTPSTTRGTAAAPVAVPASATFVHLQLIVEGAKPGDLYGVALRKIPGTQTVLSPTTAEVRSGFPVADVWLPASMLKGGVFELILTPPIGPSESFVFSIQK